MFNTRWRMFRLLGIPVSLDASWLIILALITLSLADSFPFLVNRFYPGAAEQQSPGMFWIMALAAAVAFFLCLLLHEFGHALVARHYRMPIRGITLFLFGGVAEIGDEPPSPKSEFLVAVAGPAVSVALAVLLGILAWLGFEQGWPPLVVIGLGYLSAINAMVLAFNLVPAFPLDGGRVFRSVLWASLGDLRRATYWAAVIGRGFAWLLIGWGVINFFAGNWLGGIWIGLIGLFLSNAAQAGYQHVIVRQALGGKPVRRFMNANPISVPPGLDLRQWVEDYVYTRHLKAYPVVDHGELLGMIDTQSLTQMPPAEWGRHTVAEVMRRDLTEITVAPDADALVALGKMQKNDSSRLLVTDGGRLVGILSLKDLLSFLSLLIEVGDVDDAKPERRTTVPERNGRHREIPDYEPSVR